MQRFLTWTTIQIVQNHLILQIKAFYKCYSLIGDTNRIWLKLAPQKIFLDQGGNASPYTNFAILHAMRVSIAFVGSHLNQS